MRLVLGTEQVLNRGRNQGPSLAWFTAQAQLDCLTQEMMKS